MSVVFESRNVSAVGPTLGLDVVSSSPAYVTEGPSGAPPPDNQALVSCFTSFDFGITSENKPEASSESSSIGAPDDSDDDDDDEEDEVESKPNGSLGSLASLEECLPIKRGLSSYYSGKSKSFASLSEMRTVKDIEKREKPLNKRRRTMIAYRLSKKTSFYGGRGNPTSIPLLDLNEEEVEEDEEEEEEEEEKEQFSNQSQDEEDDENEGEDERSRQLRVSKSCFSLTDAMK